MRSRERQSTTKSMSVADLKALHLAPDATVPDAERDDLHRRGRRRLGHMGWAGLAAGGLAGMAGIVWGISSHAGGGETKSVVPEPNPTTATGSATAGETATPSPEQTVSLEEMTAMTPEQFGTLPVEAQVDWVVTEANKQWNVMEGYDSDELGTLMYRDGVNDQPIVNYNPLYTPLTVDAQPIDILGQGVYYEQLSTYKNADIGRKLVSGQAMPGSSAYNYYTETIGDNPDNALGLVDSDRHSVVSSQKLDDYTAEDDKLYPQMSITERDNGNTYTETYVFVESKALQELTKQPGVGLWLNSSFEKATS